MARVLRFFTGLLEGAPWPTTGRARTDFLVAQPTFMSGVGRTLDLMGVFDAYNGSRTEQEADQWALQQDWQVAGDDLRVLLAAEAQAASERRSEV